MEVLYGLHPVEEAIRSTTRPPERVIVAQERQDIRMDRLLAKCRAANVKVESVTREELSKLAGTYQHQGVVAMVPERAMLTMEELMRRPPRYPAQTRNRFYVACDGVEDPHNLGAVLRSADAIGVDGVVLPERRSAPITPVVVKAAAGATEHLWIARVTNLVRALETMKKHHVWVIGLDERGTVEYTEFDFRLDCVLVLGREGSGMHDFTKKTCDHLLRIPMAGAVPSLNVSVAAAVVMFEALRQRRPQPPPRPPYVPSVQKGLGS